MPFTLCVLLTANPGHEQLLTEYEDQVLALLADHEARVLNRVRTLEGQITEVQILEFASEAALEDFQNDPRRLALADMRELAIAASTVMRVEPA